ncbi:mechanosensitive ion channel family protein [Spirabiliibacterium falconis]|uniref:mechanosensitive ion channel family protein n=1 Tax=Spirabiliibacterium falconis TaxID=572023 RepID=UPI001AAD8CC6|nr:mechanosensitive ion channel [Spirabiliibacterium falconis]MBE2893750.1 mechanosensitive ion channel [Spirabiliibacterium falconis]
MQTDKPISVVAHTIEGWQTWLLTMLPNVVAAIIVLVLFYFLARLLRKASLKTYERLFPQAQRMGAVVSLVVFIFMCFSGVILALDILNLTTFITHLLAGAGIVGIIAGFAFKDIASNAFAGALIKTQRPFDIGHWVKIENYLGVVEQIGLVSVTLKSLQGKIVYVPNQLIYNGVFINYSAQDRLRVVLSSGVSYGDDLEHVKSVALDVVKALPCTVEHEQADFYFTDIGSSTYNFEVRFWIAFSHYNDYLAAQSAVIMALKKRFEQENISIAYNVTTLDFGVKGGVNVFDKPLMINENK